MIKRTVIDLLEEVGTIGLNASSAVDLADRRGMTIDKTSVSSILSRLKGDGVAVHDGEKYRLARFAAKPEAPKSALEQANVVGLETRRG